MHAYIQQIFTKYCACPRDKTMNETDVLSPGATIYLLKLTKKQNKIIK